MLSFCVFVSICLDMVSFVYVCRFCIDLHMFTDADVHNIFLMLFRLYVSAFAPV